MRGNEQSQRLEETSGFAHKDCAKREAPKDDVAPTLGFRAMSRRTTS
jgi:hypothetical protein